MNKHSAKKHKASGLVVHVPEEIKDEILRRCEPTGDTRSAWVRRAIYNQLMRESKANFNLEEESMGRALALIAKIKSHMSEFPHEWAINAMRFLYYCYEGELITKRLGGSLFDDVFEAQNNLQWELDKMDKDAHLKLIACAIFMGERFAYLGESMADTNKEVDLSNLDNPPEYTTEHTNQT